MNIPGQCGQRVLAGVACLLFLLTGSPALAQRSPLAFESRYLGDGWFEYSVITTDDPFFLFLDVTGAGVPFGPVTDAGPLPVRWTNMPSADERVFWAFDGIGLGDQIRPYRVTVRLRSADTTFKRAPGGVVTMSLAIVGGYHGHLASGNIVGYWIPDVLVPCAPGEADGSATNLLLWCPMISDLPQPRLVEVIGEVGAPAGVSFEYPAPCTVRLEATRDFRSWTNVAYLYGHGSLTSWTTNVALPNYGDFFRLRLVAEGHATNLPPLGVAATLAPTKTVGSVQLVDIVPGAKTGYSLRSLSDKTLSVFPLDANLRRTAQPGFKVDRTVALPAGSSVLRFYELAE